MWDRGKKIDVIGSLLFICAGVWVSVVAVRLHLGSPTEPGPGFFPFLGGASLTVISLFLLLESLWGRSTGAESFGGIRRPLTMYAGCVAYVAVINIAGFVIATTALSVIVLRMLGRKKWWMDAGTGLVFSLGSYFLFAKILDVPLPAGAWTLFF